MPKIEADIPNVHDAIFDDITSGLTRDHMGALPAFKPMSSINWTWGDLPGHEFSNAIDDAYSQIVHWKTNLLKVPPGASGKHFVAELACLLEAFAAGLKRDVKDDVIITHKFSQLMMKGRVRPALQLLSRETRSVPLSLDGD